MHYYDDVITDIVAPLGAAKGFILGKDKLFLVESFTETFFERLNTVSVPSSVKHLHNELIDNFIELTNIVLRLGEQINHPSHAIELNKVQNLEKEVIQQRNKILDIVRG